MSVASNVGVCATVYVGLLVGVFVGVLVGVLLGVVVGVTVGVCVGVSVGVEVKVGVLVGVSVGVLVGDGDGGIWLSKKNAMGSDAWYMLLPLNPQRLLRESPRKCTAADTNELLFTST